MTRYHIAIALTGLAALLAASGAPARTADDSWSKDLEAARREAREAGKPLFVAFRCER